MFATTDPNFTIITPGGCNAKCDFCTDPMNGKPSKDYITNLAKTLSQLPPEIQQVSISGGEPTISREFMTILWLIKASQRFKKVVLTTNGSQLAKYADQLGGLVNHINISRHGTTDQENNNVFKAGNGGIPTNAQLQDVIAVLNRQGIDVTFNRVYVNDEGTWNPNLNLEKATEFVRHSKTLGASAVCFRYDQHENTLAETHFESQFSDYKKINEGGCPVCRSHTHLIHGMPVVFKASMNEPSDFLEDSIYELIYHIDGRLCTDWAADREFNPETGEVTIRKKGKPVKEIKTQLSELGKNSMILSTEALDAFIAKQPPKMKPKPTPRSVAEVYQIDGPYIATGQPDQSGCHVVAYGNGPCGRPTAKVVSGCGNTRGCG